MELKLAGEKYETGPGRLLRSSGARSWSGLHAELRLHEAGHIDAFVQPATEIAVVVRGSGTVRRRARQALQLTEARPGAIWLCPEGTPVDFVELEKGRLEVLHIYLNPLAASRGAANLHALRYASAIDDPLIREIGRTIHHEMFDETAVGALLVETLAGSLAARLVQAYTEAGRVQSPAPPVRPGRLDARRLDRVLEYIDARLEQALAIGEIAQVANLSRFHFDRAFKATTGLAPFQYVSTQRMVRARQLLASSDRSIADIALALGFSSQSSFTRAFRRAVGLSPGRYREQHATPQRLARHAAGMGFGVFVVPAS